MFFLKQLHLNFWDFADERMTHLETFYRIAAGLLLISFEQGDPGKF